MESPQDTPRENALPATPGFLRNGGEIAALLQHGHCKDSPLGPPEDWTPALKTLMATVLPAKAQIVLFWGPDYVALYNDAYAPSIGTKHPRALGRPAQENWSELWDDLEPLLRGVRDTGETFVAKDRPFYIERHGHGHGETVYFDVSYSAVREADGTVGGVLCIVTETTERVRFEHRQAFLLELGRILPSITDPERIATLTARRLGEELGAARVLFGEDNGDGQTFSVRHEYLRDARSAAGHHRYRNFGAHLLASLQAGESVARDDLHQDSGLGPGERALAQELGLAATLHVPVLRHQQLEAMLVIHHTHPHVFSEQERRLVEETAKLAWMLISHARAERALHASSAQISAMFDQASAGIAVYDRTWHFTLVNDRYCQIVGRPREALLGLSLPEIAHPESPSARLHLRTLDTDSPFEMTERYARPDGKPAWVHSQITPLVDEQGNVNSMLCVCMDISSRVQAEAQLRELNEDLEARVTAMVAQRETALAQLHEARKMETIGQLTGGIAHDFNNLLTPIMASLELVRRRVDDERSRTLIDSALQASDRARVLVARLLTFARRQTLNPRAVALSVLVNDMRELIERSLGPMIDVEVNIPGRLPAVVVDPHQLELAILNLAVNARDAMEGRGQLTLAAALDTVPAGRVQGLAEGRYVSLSVSDTGSGMDEVTLDRCLEPFFTTKGVGKGTGLGLSMVQGLAAQSGGGITIGSEAGKGTRVTLWLPISAEQGSHETPLADAAPAPQKPTHVLLVDDEEMVRQTVALQLQDLGYQVTEASSASAALRIIEKGPLPDVLVTDHIMVDQTGAQLVEELRQRKIAMPALIITGFATLTAAQLQGTEVLSKPFRRAELAERLARLVEAAG